MCRRGQAQRGIAAILIGLGVLLTTLVGSSAAQPLRAAVEANSISIDAGVAGVAKYRYDSVPFKPYVKELFTPAGLNVLLDAPPDHLHHHALMFAVAVDGVNFWAETPTAGRQRHLRFGEVSKGDADDVSRIAFVEELDWIDPAGEKRLAERREIAVARHALERVTLLTWESRLAVPTGKASVTLTGSHYFGLGLRFVRSMDAVGEFRNADNKPGVVYRGEERLVRSNWCAYTAPVEGTVVTAAMFDHPDNPRHPATWFMMAKPFAYLSATLGLHEKPLEIAAGEPLILRYGVVLWDRATESDEIDSLYQNWQERIEK